MTGKMKLEEYVEQYNEAPYELYEFAEGAVDVTDAPELSKAAQAYLEARRAFQIALSYADVEQG